jgi:AsmA family protein
MQWRAHPWLTAISAFIGALVAAVIVLMLAWDWNWFRPVVERMASLAMERQVKIGNLNASILHMTVQADDIVIDNPDGFPEDSRFGSIERISLTIDPRALFQHQFHLPALIIDKPIFDLSRASSGKANWEMGPSKPADPNNPGPSVLLGSVILNDGNVHLVDPKLRSNFAIDVNTEQPKGDGEPMIVLNANGTYIAQPISIHFRGGSLLSLRDKAKPYPIELRADHGETHVTVRGTVQDPSSLAGANVQMHLEGKDLSELSQLIAVPLAPTPPYRLDGHLDYADKSIRFTDFKGTVGSSDLSGKFAAELGHKRPKIDADMKSQNVDLTDLGGFIGTTPGKNSTPGQSEQQLQQHAEVAASSNFLPDKPMDLSAVRNNDFDVHYSAEKIEGESVPLDNLEAHLVIDDGVIKLDPLNFGVGVGNIVSKINVDARPKEPIASADVDLRRVDVNRIMQSTKTFRGTGLVGGHATLKGRGASVADMLGTSNGNIKFFMSGGDMSALLVNLAGLDFGNSLLSAMGVPSQTSIRCMVSDFDVKDGVMNTNILVLDTTAANVVGRGDVNLHDQKIDYRIETEPKHASIGSVPAPITVTGTLKSPNINVEKVPLGIRAGAAAVLGVVLTPLGALIPTIQFGLGKDSDCNALIEAAQQGQPMPSAGGNKK